MKILNHQVHWGMHLKKLSSFDKDTALKTPLTAHLSTLSSLPPSLVPIFLTPIPTPPSTASSIITTLQRYTYYSPKT